MNAKAISFTPEVLKAKLRVLEEYGRCMTRRPFRLRGSARESGDNPIRVVRGHEARGGPPSTNDWVAIFAGGTRPGNTHEVHAIGAPFGDVGDRLWIRERARVLEWATGGLGRMARLAYGLDGIASPWIPYPSRLKEPVVGRCIANGVFREGARHFLEVVEVRAEMLHRISEGDARLEGFASREDFKRVWNSLYQKREQRWIEGAREISPWCWVYTLKRAER